MLRIINHGGLNQRLERETKSEEVESEVKMAHIIFCNRGNGRRSVSGTCPV